MSRVRLLIGPVIARAEELHERVLRELPAHDGLAKLAAAVAKAAREAEDVSLRLRRWLSFHRLPAIFLAVALLGLVGWVYVTFFHSSTLTIALPDRDARELRTRITHDPLVNFRSIPILGSREAAEEVANGRVDLAFIQGGIAIPPHLPRVETPNPEIVLWFLRSTLADARNVRRIMTSIADEGSHAVAQLFTRAWKIDDRVQYLHEWTKLSEEPAYAIPDDVDAVFVVKDLRDEKTLYAVERLAAANFRLVTPDLGARAGNYEFLRPYVIPPGYLRTAPSIPTTAVSTYSVATYLVARSGLTPRLLSKANHLLDFAPPAMSDAGFEPTARDASEFFQGIDAFLGILVNLALAFLFLLGWEMLAYRKRFHELNSLISLISAHQSSKDVLAVSDPLIRANNLLYLSLCSDLLGLISMIAGYYTQENSSLLFNSLPEIIHQRSDGLKINIQLKILHATIEIPRSDRTKLLDAGESLPNELEPVVIPPH